MKPRAITIPETETVTLAPEPEPQPAQHADDWLYPGAMLYDRHGHAVARIDGVVMKAETIDTTTFNSAFTTHVMGRRIVSITATAILQT